jgi:hypothetical protein
MAGCGAAVGNIDQPAFARMAVFRHSTTSVHTAPRAGQCKHRVPLGARRAARVGAATRCPADPSDHAKFSRSLTRSPHPTDDEPP